MIVTKEELLRFKKLLGFNEKEQPKSRKKSTKKVVKKRASKRKTKKR